MDAANRGAVERLKRKRFDSSGSSPDEDEPPAKIECAIFSNTWTLFNDNFTWIREKPQMARCIRMSMLVIRLHFHGKHLRGHAGAWLRTLLQSHILNGWKTLSLDVFIRAVAELQNEKGVFLKRAPTERPTSVKMLLIKLEFPCWKGLGSGVPIIRTTKSWMNTGVWSDDLIVDTISNG